MKRPASFEAEGPRPGQVSRPISITVEDEDEFILAVKQYKAQSGRQFPTCSELLEILKSIGYAKRIWKPVEPWSPTCGQSSSGWAVGRDSQGVVGWYSSVETPLSL
jgi:hypothetical protein